MENKVFRFLLKNGESYDDAGDKVNPALVALGFKLYEVGKDVAFSDKLGVWRDIDNCPMKTDDEKQREADEAEIAQIDTDLIKLDADSQRDSRAGLLAVTDALEQILTNLADVKGNLARIKEVKAKITYLRDFEDKAIAARTRRKELWDKWHKEETKPKV